MAQGHCFGAPLADPSPNAPLANMAQGHCFGAPLADPSPNAPLANMAPMKAMKAMKAMRAMKASGAAMTKGALAEALATQMDLKKSVCGKVIGTLAEIGAGEV